jgi:hypothetical protein
MAAPLRGGMTGERCRKRAGQVAQAMLAQLGDLDPCEDGRAARTGRDVGPGGHRIVVPAKPTKQVGPIHGDSAGVPGRREGGPSRPCGLGR